MASFRDKTREELHTARLLAQLTPDSKINGVPLSGSETWHCTFSPDETFFAWSCGNRLVTLIPWNSCKFTLSHLLKGLVLPKPGARPCVESSEEHALQQAPLTIDTGSLVLSMAFASTVGRITSLPYWSRLAKCKSIDLIFVTGQSNNRIRTWDITTGHLLLELMGHSGPVSGLSFSPVGHVMLASGAQDGTLYVWDFQRDNVTQEALQRNGRQAVHSCVWSSSANSMVSVGACKTAYVWNMKNFKLQLKLEGHTHDIMAASYSPDGCLITTASFDTRVILWDGHTGEMLKTFGHLFPPPSPIYASGMNGSFVRGVSYSRDGAHFATVADDGYLRFWDVTEDDPLCVGSVEEALCCTYSPSGQIVAVGDRTGMVSFWQAPMSVKRLLFLCRTTIRQHVTSEHVKDLTIPKSLIGYLLYEELQ